MRSIVKWKIEMEVFFHLAKSKLETSQLDFDEIEVSNPINSKINFKVYWQFITETQFFKYQYQKPTELSVAVQYKVFKYPSISKSI